jgi:hypothetical protein
MTNKTDFFSNYKDHALTRPRDVAWQNWKSWKDATVGDKVQGYVVDAFYRPEEKNSAGQVVFKEQRGLTLKQADGVFINVGIKYLPFVLSATDNLKLNDPLVIELTDIQKPKEKGQNGAKIFSYFGTNLPENAGNKSVKELTEEDKNAGGSKEPIAEDKTEDVPFTSGSEAVDNF